MCIPLWAGGSPWGVLDVEEEQTNAFGEDEVRLLTAVADQMGSALHIIELSARLGEPAGPSRIP